MNTKYWLLVCGRDEKSIGCATGVDWDSFTSLPPPPNEARNKGADTEFIVASAPDLPHGSLNVILT